MSLVPVPTQPISHTISRLLQDLADQRDGDDSTQQTDSASRNSPDIWCCEPISTDVVGELHSQTCSSQQVVSAVECDPQLKPCLPSTVLSGTRACQDKPNLNLDNDETDYDCADTRNWWYSRIVYIKNMTMMNGSEINICTFCCFDHCTGKNVCLMLIYTVVWMIVTVMTMNKCCHKDLYCTHTNQQ